jgi:hypothetical protein
LCPRIGLDDVRRRKILPVPGLESQPFGRPARSQSVYRLRYIGPTYKIIIGKIIVLYILIVSYLVSSREDRHFWNAHR